MGQIHAPPRCLGLVAVISRYPAAMEWARQRCQSRAGREAAELSPAFEFRETNYYQSTMGDGLHKWFLVFDGPWDPATLADWKHDTNDWEAEYAALRRHAEPRPLNLDPGYLTLAKLVLASTKDHAHRIYLRDGIYAEVTLSFRQRRWQAFPWTFPDYRRDDYHAFFTHCRQRLRNAHRDP